MKIVKIQKISNDKYRVKLDDTEFITFDNVILNNNLLYKKELKKEELNKLKEETNYFNNYNKLLKFCTIRIRCKSEVLNYIEKQGIGKEEGNIIITKLSSLGFLDDKKYCFAFINDKVHLHKYGIKKIEKLLREKNIDSYIIQEGLNNLNYDELNSNLEKKVCKEIKANHKNSNYEMKNKLLNKYLKEGYDKEKIVEIIDKYQLDDDNILEKELSKFYMKYKKKYDDEIFKIKLKQKLLQKGFSIDKINELIEKKQENS